MPSDWHEGFADDMHRLCSAIERCASALERLADRPEILLVPPGVEPLVGNHSGPEDDELADAMLERVLAVRDQAEDREQRRLAAFAEAPWHLAGRVRVQPQTSGEPEPLEVRRYGSRPERFGDCPACGAIGVRLTPTGLLASHATPGGGQCANHGGPE